MSAHARRPPRRQEPGRPSGARVARITAVVLDAATAAIAAQGLDPRRLAWALSLAHAVNGAVKALVFQDVDERWADAALSSDLALRRVAAFWSWLLASRALRSDPDLYAGLQRDGRAIARRIVVVDDVVAEATARLDRERRRAGGDDEPAGYEATLLGELDELLAIRRHGTDRSRAARERYFAAAAAAAQAALDEFYRRAASAMQAPADGGAVSPARAPSRRPRAR